MEYAIRPSDDGRYVILEMVGEVTIPEVMQALVESHSMGGRLGVRCFLVDATAARNNELALSYFKFAQDDIPDMPAIDKLACIASLVEPADHSHDFFEAATRGAGYDFTIFRDRGLAIEHLHRAADRFDRLQRHAGDPAKG